MIYVCGVTWKTLHSSARTPAQQRRGKRDEEEAWRVSRLRWEKPSTVDVAVGRGRIASRRYGFAERGDLPPTLTAGSAH